MKLILLGDLMKDENSVESDGVIAVRRAINILNCFSFDQAVLSLAELSKLTGYHKSTVLRLARTLALDNFLIQRQDGNWQLASAAGRLGACYQAHFNVLDVIEPVLRELTQITQESSTFYIRELNRRICVARVTPPRSILYNVRVGSDLPLDSGGPGRVLLAFSGEPGEPYEMIRRQGYAISLGERTPDVSSISVPVYGLNWSLFGSISVSGPTSRLTQEVLLSYKDILLQKAEQLSRSMMGMRKSAITY